MRLSSRLERLEEHLHTRVCPLCHDKGRVVVSYVHENDQPPVVQGCPSCGRGMHILVRYVRKPFIDGRLCSVDGDRKPTGAELAGLLD